VTTPPLAIDKVSTFYSLGSLNASCLRLLMISSLTMIRLLPLRELDSNISRYWLDFKNTAPLSGIGVVISGPAFKPVALWFFDDCSFRIIAGGPAPTLHYRITSPESIWWLPQYGFCFIASAFPSMEVSSFLHYFRRDSRLGHKKISFLSRLAC